MPGRCLVFVCPCHYGFIRWRDPLILHQPGNNFSPGQLGGGGGLQSWLGAHPVWGGGGEGHGLITRPPNIKTLGGRFVKYFYIRSAHSTFIHENYRKKRKCLWMKPMLFSRGLQQENLFSLITKTVLVLKQRSSTRKETKSLFIEQAKPGQSFQESKNLFSLKSLMLDLFNFRDWMVFQQILSTHRIVW